jgi:endonuclease YncB( thermonuclease family)
MPKKKSAKKEDPAWLYRRRAAVVAVTDGDTVVLMIDDGRANYSREKMRLWGINAPEIDTEEGKKAKAFLESKMPVGTEVWIETVKDTTEKYGRYLVNVYLDLNGMELQGWVCASVNNMLCVTGHAKPYFGKGKVK